MANRLTKLDVARHHLGTAMDLFIRDRDLKRLIASAKLPAARCPLCPDSDQIPQCREMTRCAIIRHTARFRHPINTRFSAHTVGGEGPVVQGRAMSNGCTFAPPAIRGFDGSKCSRSSRFWTSARAATKASFRLLACRSATLKKASPK